MVENEFYILLYKIIVFNIYLTFASSHIGVSTPSPDLLFALTQKVGKKVKTTPALPTVRQVHSKNLRSVSSNRPNSFRRNTSKLKQGRFLTAYLNCFSVHQPRSRIQERHRYTIKRILTYSRKITRNYMQYLFD